jgi:Protein of unknown function (DUF1236)
LTLESGRFFVVAAPRKAETFRPQDAFSSSGNPTVIPMSTLPRTTILAAALSLAVAGAWAEAPADPTAPVLVAPKINLSLEQRDTIRELVKEVGVASAAPQTPMAIGDTVPNEVELHPLPARIGEKVSKVKNHLFFRKGAEFAIVDPKDNKIVDVISEADFPTANHAATRSRPASGSSATSSSQ